MFSVRSLVLILVLGIFSVSCASHHQNTEHRHMDLAQQYPNQLR